MRRNVLILVASCLALASCAEAAQQAPKTEEDKALYNLGVMLSRGIQSFNFSAKELEMVKAGLAEAQVEKIALADTAVMAHLEGLTVRKVIVVKDRIVNIVAN